MPYQGLAFAIFMGVGIATAAILYFLDRQPEAPFSRTGWSNRQRCPPLEPTSGTQEENRQDRSRPSRLRARKRNQKTSSQNVYSCTICQDTLNNMGFRILPCAHSFHGSCIDRWFEVFPAQPGSHHPAFLPAHCLGYKIHNCNLLSETAEVGESEFRISVG
uniref:RING-type domain-containing protein n=1 Tax=Timema shepardi TaxID=629360 RepID=A0A7R9AW17_TIMSH|nr:unnamed protein product [Timema shepardi]